MHAGIAANKQGPKFPINSRDQLDNLTTLEAARTLLGWQLVRTLPEGIIRGRITETEAYLHDDPASHSFRGQTPRNKSMFGSSGSAYVYFTYGNHFCLNVVTGREGEGEAVLIRSIEIIAGEQLALKNRQGKLPLSTGPGRLCQALRINRELDGHNLKLPPLQLVIGSLNPKETIIATPRIGLRKATELPYRFVIKSAPYR